MEIELKASKLEIKKSSEEKEAVQTKYREASTVISNQQRNITEFLKKIKVQDSLALIEQEKRGTDTNEGSEECEEVWEELDDNSGNMVSQRRKEINKYQWRPDYTCNICKKLFESDQQLRNHTKEHKRIQEQIIKCHHCDFMTNDADIFMNHTVVVHKRNFKCLTCELVFSSESELAMHAGQAHGLDYSKQKSSNKSIDCHDCEESFHNKFELMAHKKVKHFKKRLCSYYHGNRWGCKFQASCLNIHNENIVPALTDDKRSRIPCKHGDSCLYFKINSCLYKHTNHIITSSALLMEPQDVELLDTKKCTICSYETNTEVEFKWHRETQHGARPKEFKGITATTTTRYPIGHAQWAANKNMSEYKCMECTSVFTVESMLNEHINQIHNNKYNHQCKQCSNVFSSQGDMSRHIQEKHKEVSSLESAILKISQHMETISQRIDSIEHKSLTNFPNLGPQLGMR